MKREEKSETATIEELRIQLFEANCIIDAIKEGAIDAIVVNKYGMPNIYSLESADYTYRILVEKSGEGALSISSGGLVLYCNECFANMVGLPVNKIIGTYFNSYIDSVGKFQQLKTALSEGPSKGEIVLNVDGRKLPVYASLTSLQPQVEAIGIIITDLSQKRKHEDALAVYRQTLEAKINELKRINFNLEQFVHVISYDVKEPLRKILALTGELANKKHKASREEDVNKLLQLDGAAQRLSAMVNDLSTYALSIHHADTSEVDLNTIVREVTEDMAMTIQERKASIICKELPNIKGSPIQIRRLFLNLINNAIRFSHVDSQPQIRISSEVEDCVDLRRPNKKYYRIDLHDHSGGIAPDAIAKLMDRFSQAQNGTDTSVEGMGLVICKRIMENHAGKMEIQNTLKNGSLFNLYFPLSS
jgi:PAS domain S-box-containing protein